MKRFPAIHILKTCAPACCGLLLSLLICGCQSQPLTPRARAEQIRQLRAEQEQPTFGKHQALSAVHEQYDRQPEPASQRERSRWTSWLGRLPRPQRIPLPRTDMGGNDIAVLEPGTAAVMP